MAVEIENSEAAVAGIGEHDRRRAGRSDISPMLIPLLRDPAGDQSKLDEWAPIEPLAPARGLVLGVVLSIPIWAAICGVLYALSR